jgi:hypothetical protein
VGSSFHTYRRGVPCPRGSLSERSRT